MPTPQKFGGVQLALDSPYCEKYSPWLLFSTGEVTNPWVRYSCVVQLWGHQQLCCVCDLSRCGVAGVRAGCCCIPTKGSVTGQALSQPTQTCCTWLITFIMVTVSPSQEQGTVQNQPLFVSLGLPTCFPRPHLLSNLSDKIREKTGLHLALPSAWACLGIPKNDWIQWFKLFSFFYYTSHNNSEVAS